MFNIGNEDAQDCTEPTIDEVKNQINNFKNHKASGEDEIQGELLKHGGDEISFRVWKLICRIWTNK